MLTVRLLNVRRILITASLVLSVVGSLGYVHPAAAMPVGPGGDDHQKACASLQSQVNALMDEYQRLEESQREGQANEARMNQILLEVKDIVEAWGATGCQRDYGDITIAMPGSTDPLHPNLNLPTGGVYYRQ